MPQTVYVYTTGMVADMVNPFLVSSKYPNFSIITLPSLFRDGVRYMGNPGYLDRETCPSISNPG